MEAIHTLDSALLEKRIISSGTTEAEGANHWLWRAVELAGDFGLNFYDRRGVRLMQFTGLTPITVAASVFPNPPALPDGVTDVTALAFDQLLEYSCDPLLSSAIFDSNSVYEEWTAAGLTWANIRDKTAVIEFISVNTAPAIYGVELAEGHKIFDWPHQYKVVSAQICSAASGMKFGFGCPAPFEVVTTLANALTVTTTPGAIPFSVTTPSATLAVQFTAGANLTWRVDRIIGSIIITGANNTDTGTDKVGSMDLQEGRYRLVLSTASGTGTLTANLATYDV